MQEHASSKKLEEFTRWFLRLTGIFQLRTSSSMRLTILCGSRWGRCTAYGDRYTGDPNAVFEGDHRQIEDCKLHSSCRGQRRKNGRIIAESKSGGENRPNKVWREKEQRAVEYITRFVGLCETEEEIGKVSCGLLSKYFYENERARYRYIIFSEEPNAHYRTKGLDT